MKLLIFLLFLFLFYKISVAFNDQSLKCGIKKSINETISNENNKNGNKRKLGLIDGVVTKPHEYE